MLETISKGIEALVAGRLSYLAGTYRLLPENYFDGRPNISAEQALDLLAEKSVAGVQGHIPRIVRRARSIMRRSSQAETVHKADSGSPEKAEQSHAAHESPERTFRTLLSGVPLESSSTYIVPLAKHTALSDSFFPVGYCHGLWISQVPNVSEAYLSAVDRTSQD